MGLAAALRAASRTPTDSEDGMVPRAARPARRPAGRRPRAAVLCLLAAALVAGPVTGGSATAPTPDQVARQQAEAAELADAAQAQGDEAAAARARLADLASSAGQALEEYQSALHAVDAARADHWVQTEQLATAEEASARSRGELGRWAASAYRQGHGGTGYDNLLAVLESDSADDLSLRLQALGRVGRTRDLAVQEAVVAAEQQMEAAERSEQTATRAMDLAQAAEAARLRSEAAVQEQRAQLAVLESLLATAEDSAAAAQAEADRLARAQQQADAILARHTATGSVTLTGEVGRCAGQDISGFPNGQIPSQALCPLWGAPEHLLRADAAHAFEQMAKAWARDHGRPICVTDSYRPLADQVRLYATKPHLAAKPGTSNHGWGMALDLCGGIQSFGTPQHRWMQENAGLYGWFHPRWAQQGGSRPEPWHWEFSG